MKTLVCASLLLLLSGCSWWKCVPEVRYQTVEVPVYTAIAPPEVKKPLLQIDDPIKRAEIEAAPESEKSEKIAQAFRSSLIQLKEYSKKLEEIVETYRQAAKDGNNTN